MLSLLEGAIGTFIINLLNILFQWILGFFPEENAD